MDAHVCQEVKAALGSPKLSRLYKFKVQRSGETITCDGRCCAICSDAGVFPLPNLKGCLPLLTPRRRGIVKGSLVTGKREWEVYRETITPEA